MRGIEFLNDVRRYATLKRERNNPHAMEVAVVNRGKSGHAGQSSNGNQGLGYRLVLMKLVKKSGDMKNNQGQIMTGTCRRCDQGQRQGWTIYVNNATVAAHGDASLRTARPQDRD